MAAELRVAPFSPPDNAIRPRESISIADATMQGVRAMAVARHPGHRTP
jgi:hypothetical protein